MFTWLQTNFQKHYKVLFGVLLVIIIFAFVFTIGDFAGIDSLQRERSANHRFYEFDLKTEEQKAAFFQSAALSAYIQFRGDQLPSEQIQNYAFSRGAALHLANLHNIPGPTTEQLTEFVKEMALFQNPQGEFDPVIYTSALDGLKTGRNFTEGRLSALLEEDFRIHQIQEALRNPGLVLPHEVLDDLKRENTTWSVTVATTDLSAYEPTVDLSDEKIQAYYDENAQNYRTPDRRVISYVEYSSSALASEIKTTEDDLNEYFEINRYKYETLPDPNAEAGAPAPAEPTFEENKAKVAADYKLEKARILAEDNATELVMAIVDSERRGNSDLSVNSNVFKNLMQEKGKEVKTTTPFSISETPMGLKWGRLVIAEAFKLVPGRFYSEPVTHEDKTYVLFLKEEIEGSVPDLGSIKDQVIADYSSIETNRLRIAHGKEIKEELAASELDADGFAAAAEAKDFTVQSYEDFKATEPAEGLDRSLLGSIDSLAPGEMSDMIMRGNTGHIVFVSKKDIPEIGSEDEDYTSRLEQLKTMYQQVALGQYMEALTTTGLIEGNLAVAQSDS